MDLLPLPASAAVKSITAPHGALIAEQVPLQSPGLEALPVLFLPHDPQLTPEPHHPCGPNKGHHRLKSLKQNPVTMNQP
jgi:hypothetical protein